MQVWLIKFVPAYVRWSLVVAGNSRRSRLCVHVIRSDHVRSLDLQGNLPSDTSFCRSHLSDTI